MTGNVYLHRAERNRMATTCNPTCCQICAVPAMSTRFRAAARGLCGRPQAPDLVNRQFGAQAPNTLFVADLTYVRLISGFVYTAFVVDAFAGVIGGWKSQRPSGPRSSNGASPRPARCGEGRVIP